MATDKRNVPFTVLHAFIADVMQCNVCATIRLAVCSLAAAGKLVV